MAWELPPRDVVMADRMLIECGTECLSCGTFFDPFEVRDSDGLPPHDCS